MNINPRIALSIASIVAAGSIGIGGTFAYFTSTATNTGNSILSGTLKLDITNPVDGAAFSVSGLTPGNCANAGSITVQNNGTTDMKFKSYVSETSDTKNLSDVLTVNVTLVNVNGIANGATILSDTSFNSLENTTTTPLRWDSVAGVIGNPPPFAPTWNATYSVQVCMASTAGDEYQNATLNADINFFGTQLGATL